MKKIHLYILILVITIITTSCATVAARDDSSSEGRLYPATQTDVMLLYYAGSSGPKYAPLGIFPLIDLPVSLITDTVLLPVDLAKKQKKRKNYVELENTKIKHENEKDLTKK